MTALCVISGEDRPQIPFSRSREAMENAIKKLDNDDTFQWTHTQLENMLASEGRELIRQLLQDHLELRALREQRVVVVDGQQKAPGTLFFWGSAHCGGGSRYQLVR